MLSLKSQKAGIFLLYALRVPGVIWQSTFFFCVQVNCSIFPELWWTLRQDCPSEEGEMSTPWVKWEVERRLPSRSRRCWSQSAFVLLRAVPK